VDFDELVALHRHFLTADLAGRGDTRRHDRFP